MHIKRYQTNGNNIIIKIVHGTKVVVIIIIISVYSMLDIIIK